MSDFAQQALEELQKVTGSDNRDNPWLGVVAAVYLWHARIEQLTKACEALLDAHDQSFVGREEMRDLYYSAHPRRAAAYKQARKAIESVRGIEASYPDPGCEAAARERDDLNALCDRQADILSRVAVALRGPEPPQTKWSHHDLPERAEAILIDHICERCGDRIPLEHPCRCSVCWNHINGELANLRARVAGYADGLENRRWGRVIDVHEAIRQVAAEVRNLLREEVK